VPRGLVMAAHQGLASLRKDHEPSHNNWISCPSAETHVLCDAATQLKVKLCVQGKFESHLLMRDGLVEGNPFPTQLLSEVNEKLGLSGGDRLDHVVFWRTDTPRMIDCVKDTAVALIPLSENIMMESMYDNETFCPGAGSLVVSPSLSGPPGKMFSVQPSSGTGTWVELRRSKEMRSKVCIKGPSCTYRPCGYSNHDAPSTP
jgi:hypothetical protein